MILHTILPKESIFPSEEQTSKITEQMMLYNGIPVVVENVNMNEVRIKQVLSTDPNHYLNPDCYPGKIISR